MKKFTFISSVFFLSFFLQGCYTQLAMFYPDPEIETNEEEQFYDTYNRALPSLKGESYAQDSRTAMPLSYSSMQRRFYTPYSAYSGFNGYYDPFYYSNPYYPGLNGYRYGYGYNGYNSYGYAPYLYTTDTVGYGSLIPTGNRQKRSFSRDRYQGATTMLQTTRSSNTYNNTTNSSNSSYTNSSSVSSSRSSGYSSSGSSNSRSSSSSKSSGGRRATKRR
tara:strand:- start:68 stop:724 length:657 start_codon:yes stop_codon:yes gene_type:complete